MSKLHLQLSLGVALFAAAGCDGLKTAPFQGTPGAIITIVFDASPTDTMEVALTDAATISAARLYAINGTGGKVLTGPILKGFGFDPLYQFHFIPDSVRFADAGAASCNAVPMHTSADISAFFQQSAGDPNAASAKWCPLTARPIAVSGEVLIGNPSK